ncbi:MAG: bifunctional phosphoribosylaminoimidazolecarboxamide formyltransferase/IMP cyclohydrolase [Miltoncostaeaceae bacterium]
MKVRRALISVSDKDGLEALGRALADMGVEILSTGGTAARLEELDIPVTPVEAVTGQAEILGGRVKTLHPVIHGGILARPDHDGDAAELAGAGIEEIDLVAVNLYPFEEWLHRPDASDDDLVEQIDIGGPTMIRAAAKNHARVAVLTSPEQYDDVIAELRSSGGELSKETRRSLAGAAFARTARYDTAIAEWVASADEDFPPSIMLAFDRALDLSYGENPHQRAAYYTEPGARTHLMGRVEQVHGKALSFNNLLDVDAARGLLAEFELPACVIVKHNNPCGVAVAGSVLEAYERARDCDPVSAYGGIIAVNRPVDGELGELLSGTFIEVLIAPDYEAPAMDALTRKPNTRILHNTDRRRRNPGERDYRRVSGGMLVQDRDAESEDRESMSVATETQPSEEEWGDLVFAWRVAKHVKSNAIVLAKDLATVGIGAGQMSRVDSVELSVKKAGDRTKGAVLASDAFFPFADGPEAALDAGVTAVVQPGGSIRDDEVIAAMDERGAAMVLTGRRHFRH